MKKQIPRHNSIGEKLREARKAKGLTLGELAKGICSLGKMSNIENGHVSVTDEELKKFCEKLNIPINFFADPNIEDKINELDNQKQIIIDLIRLKNWKSIKLQLASFKKKIETYAIHTREIDYNYLSGVYYYEIKHYLLAEEFLTKVMEEEEENNYNLRLKIKAYNVLVGIYFYQKKSAKSNYILSEALKLSQASPTITKEERDNIYYNFSILSLYTGLNDLALNYINKVNHHIISPLETEYIKLLISFLENDSVDEMREDLFNLREKVQQTNDREGILRGWALMIYSDMTAKPALELIQQWKDSFYFDLDLISQEFEEETLSLLQLSIYVCLKKSEEQDLIEELFEKTRAFLPNISNQELIARSYFLEGIFERHYKQNSARALTLMQQALDTFDKADEGLLKADILFEISSLLGIDNQAMDALKIYHSHTEGNFLFTHFHELTLPRLKY
ncbi:MULTISPECIES: helix-turn-helix domain-containing protein [Bacillaceae]|uniref:helix-turn-helix domain-containing protein n=1 Tax=Metabacillus sp. 22489 TaxID=3453928 RepID=UPI000BA71FCE|nr:hypothetical protein CHH83_00010 [Bacillus sp. 7586-K]